MSGIFCPYDLARYGLTPVEFAREVLGFQPTEGQVEVLDPRNKRVVVNCCRQWGKSTIAAVRMVHQAVFYPESTTVVLAPALRQMGELLRRAHQFLKRMGLEAGSDAMSRPSLVLANGSRMVGLPAREDNIRGFTVDLAIADEAARIPEELWRTLRPMLARNARSALVLLSTPNGDRGFFYETWQYGGEQWKRIRGPAAECAGIPAEFLAEEREALTPEDYAQEYECEFRQSQKALFGAEDLRAAMAPEVEPLFGVDGSRRVGQAPATYYLGLDLGQARDYAVLVVGESRALATGLVNKVTYEKVVRLELQIRHIERFPLRTPYPVVQRKVEEICERMAFAPGSALVVDTGGVGRALVDYLAQANLGRLGLALLPVQLTAGGSVGTRQGVMNVPKHLLMNSLENVIRNGLLRIGCGCGGRGSCTRSWRGWRSGCRRRGI